MSKVLELCKLFDLDLTSGVYVSDEERLPLMPYDLQGSVILINCSPESAVMAFNLRYFEEQKVWIVPGTEDSNGSDKQEVKLSDLNRLVKAELTGKYDFIILNRLGKNVTPFTLTPLIDTMAALRAPDGCPWDKLQTHSSLRRYFIEEVYEVMEAIDKKDMKNLQEELGDVLLQVIFHARLAEERGDFSVQEVINDINEKMIRRHPQVFEQANSSEIGDTLLTWEALKAKEKGFLRKNLLSGISKELPALLRAQKLQEKAAKVGFDWDSVEPMWEKFYEEIEEFKAAIDEKSIKNIEIEGGDILFSLINLFRWYKISGENALSRTNTKFQQRFTYVEGQVEKSGKSWKDFSLTELDEFWKAAKLQECEKSY